MASIGRGGQGPPAPCDCSGEGPCWCWYRTPNRTNRPDAAPVPAQREGVSFVRGETVRCRKSALPSSQDLDRVHPSVPGNGLSASATPRERSRGRRPSGSPGQWKVGSVFPQQVDDISPQHLAARSSSYLRSGLASQLPESTAVAGFQRKRGRDASSSHRIGRSSFRR